MTTTSRPAPPTTPAQAARLLNAYARRWHAGAFATPTAKDLSAAWNTPVTAPGTHWYWWDGTAAVGRRLERDSARRDFTGRPICHQAGQRVLTHIAPLHDNPLPDLSRWHWVWAYQEDTTLIRALRAQGRELAGIRISAASEIIGCWGLPGTGHTYPPHDQATISRLPVTISSPERTQILTEVAAVRAWHDDFPYYSDGSWTAVSLRGFNPADPTWGIKPTEMSRGWWSAHPEATRYHTCDWTTLAASCPTLVNLSVAVTAGWGGTLERVRLLRMSARPGKIAKLGRHTDITDRAAGTADGQIIRLHIPLVTHPDITMTGWDLDGTAHPVHLPAWSMWYLDARKPHAVANPSPVDRIHLVIDVTATPAARKALAAGIEHAAPIR